MPPPGFSELFRSLFIISFKQFSFLRTVLSASKCEIFNRSIPPETPEGWNEGITRSFIPAIYVAALLFMDLCERCQNSQPFTYIRVVRIYEELSYTYLRPWLFWSGKMKQQIILVLRVQINPWRWKPSFAHVTEKLADSEKSEWNNPLCP